MTAMNAAGRHGGSARVSRRLNSCALKSASETSNAKRVLKATPKPPEEPEPPDGAGSGGGGLDEAPPDTWPPRSTPSSPERAARPPNPVSEFKSDESSPLPAAGHRLEPRRL